MTKLPNFFFLTEIQPFTVTVKMATMNEVCYVNGNGVDRKWE